MYPLEFYGEMYGLSLFVTEYTNNGRLAIILIDQDGEDFADMTVNLPGERCPEGCAFVDTNNLEGIDSWLAENGIAEHTGISARSGFCTYPLMKFNL